MSLYIERRRAYKCTEAAETSFRLKLLIYWCRYRYPLLPVPYFYDYCGDMVAQLLGMWWLSCGNVVAQLWGCGGSVVGDVVAELSGMWWLSCGDVVAQLSKATW
jgi:hypothetical protein